MKSYKENNKFKIISKIIIIICFLFTPQSQAYNAEQDEVFDFVWIEEVKNENNIDEVSILSKCAVIYDRDSKSIIWGKNEDKKVPMASTTKIMTAIILVENVNDLSQKVEVCKEAALTGGSRLGLKTGDKITYNELLYGLMLCSGNDAAVQIAISVGGSVDGFSKLMNEKAKEIGLTNTQFVTPHGLDAEGHYTTAYELAVIADYALKIDKIAEVVSTKSHWVNINNGGKEISNTNELLGYLDGVNGVKTGFTNGARQMFSNICFKKRF